MDIEALEQFLAASFPQAAAAGFSITALTEARASLLKLGKRIAVAQVRLHGADPDALYAHATVTYSLPPSR
jgi:acyl-coenzyme A thioesterase PaaI-like protein